MEATLKNLIKQPLFILLIIIGWNLSVIADADASKRSISEALGEKEEKHTARIPLFGELDEEKEPEPPQKKQRTLIPSECDIVFYEGTIDTKFDCDHLCKQSLRKCLSVIEEKDESQIGKIDQDAITPCGGGRGGHPV